MDSSSPKKTTPQRDLGRFTPVPDSDPSCPRRQITAQICGRTKYFLTKAGRDAAEKKEAIRLQKKELRLAQIREAKDRALSPNKLLVKNYEQRQNRFNPSRSMTDGERELQKLLRPIKPLRKSDTPTGHWKLCIFVLSHLRDSLGTKHEESAVRAFRLHTSKRGSKQQTMYYQPCEYYTTQILDCLLEQQGKLGLNTWPRTIFNQKYYGLIKFLKQEQKRLAKEKQA